MTTTVPSRKTPPSSDTPVEALWNLSDKSAGWLREEGVATFADLERADLIELWAALKSRYPQVTRLMYFALVGARLNCHWREIPEAERERIDAFVRQMAPSGAAKARRRKR